MPGPLDAASKAATQAVARFDAAIDTRVDRFRGHPHVDRLMYAASELGDFSLIWHLVSATRALGPDRRLTHAVRVAAVLGAESALVNGPVKSLFRRHRPAWEQERPLRLRRPRTTSFPSGCTTVCEAALFVGFSMSVVTRPAAPNEGAALVSRWNQIRSRSSVHPFENHRRLRGRDFRARVHLGWARVRALAQGLAALATHTSFKPGRPRPSAAVAVAEAAHRLDRRPLRALRR